jgi:drug/metabolite transporter (DMT)-like permease
MTHSLKISVITKCCLAATVLFWSSAFVGIRIALDGYTPGGLALGRFLIASLGMALILAFRKKHTISFKHKIFMMLAGVLTIAGYHVPLNLGEVTVPSGIASFIISQSTIFATLFAVVFLQEKLNRYTLFGIGISFIGMLIILSGQNSTHGFQLSLGLFYILISTVLGSIYSIMQKLFQKKYHPLEITSYMVWGGTLAMLIYMPELKQSLIHASVKADLTMVYLGVFPSALAYIAWGYTLQHMPAARAVNFLYLMPLVAVLLGFLILGEVPSILSFAGGLIALYGLWVVNHSYQKMPPAIE